MPAGIQKSVRLMLAAVVGLLSMGSSMAQDSSYVDDCEGKGNYNKFRAYWYVFDDNAKNPYLASAVRDSVTGAISYPDSLDGGNSSITNIPRSEGIEYSDFVMTANEGYDNSYGARIDFQMGDVKPQYEPGKEYDCNVGIGTGLIAEGQNIDLTTATKITYWAKASVTGAPTTPVIIRFEIATNVGLLPLFSSHYGTFDTITTEWKQYTIWLAAGAGTDSLKQPSWAKDERHPLYGDSAVAIAPLDLRKASKIAWLISVEQNPALAEGQGTLWLDNIVIHNYKWYPPDACIGCVTDAGTGAAFSPDSAFLFSRVSDNGINFLDKFFYAYNDADGRAVTTPITQYSHIDTAAATYLPANPTKPELKLTGHGPVAGDTAAWIDFTLGPTFIDTIMLAGKPQKITVSPFVGLGSSLANEDDSSPYNADGNGVTGVYFEYQTTGNDIDYVTFEVLTNKVLPLAGAQYHILLPATKGEWKGAIIPFSVLQLPAWDALGDVLNEPVKSSAITKFQWAYEGAPGQKGTLAVDNVYLLKFKHYNKVSHDLAWRNAAFFNPRLKGNQIHFSLPVALGAAEVSLFSAQGKALATMKIMPQAAGHQLPVSTQSLANGIYFLTATTKKGVISAPLMITR